MAVRFDVETVHRSVNAGQVIADARKMEAASKAQARAWKELSKEIGITEKHIKSAGKAKVDAASKAAQLARKQEAINKIMRETGASAATARKVVSAYSKVLDTQGNKALATARKLDVLERETRELTRAQREAAGQMSLGQKFASGMTSNLLQLAAAAASVHLAMRAVGASVRTFTEFEDNLLGTKAVTQATAEQMAMLESQAKQLGATTPRTAAEIAGLQQELARAGFSIQEIMSSTGGLIAFASAGQLELADATDKAATILRAFDIAVQDLPRVTDVLATSASSAKTDIGQLSSAFEFAAAPAAALKIPLEEAAAAIAVVQERGVVGTKAGRGLIGVFRELGKESEKKSRILEKLGLTYRDVNIEQKGFRNVIETLASKTISFNDAIELVGSEAAPAFLNLTAGVEKFGSIVDKNMNEAEGATMRMAETMESGLGGVGRELKSAAEAAQIAFAEGLEPALSAAGVGMTELLRRTQPLFNDLGKLAGAVVSLTSALTGLTINTAIAKEINSATREVNSNRDAIMSWQDAIRSSNAGMLKKALEEATDLAASTNEEIEKLNDIVKDHDAAYTKRLAAAKRIEELKGTAQVAETFVAKLGYSLENLVKSLPPLTVSASEMQKAFAKLKETGPPVPDPKKIKEAESLSKSLRTEQEKLNDELKVAKDLYKANALNAEDMARAQQKWARAIIESVTGLKQLNEISADPFEDSFVGPRMSPEMETMRQEQAKKDVSDRQLANKLLSESREEWKKILDEREKILRLQKKGLLTEEEANKLLNKQRENVEFVNEELEDHRVLWERIRDIVIDAAVQSGGAWGSFLDGLAGQVQNIASAFDQLAGIAAGRGDQKNAQLLGGASALLQGDYGGAIAGFAQGFGLTGGGISDFGGRNEGNFMAEGAQLGAQFGGAYGAIIGAAVGAFVKSGADDMHSHLAEAAGRADLVVTQAEGGLAEVAQQMEAAIEGVLNAIQDSIIADLDFEAVGLGVHLREDRARVELANGIEVVFNTIEEATAFAVQATLAAQANISGLGDHMRNLFENLSGTRLIGSLEEIQAAVQLAQTLDFAETGITGEFIKMEAEWVRIANQFGMSVSATIEAIDEEIAARRRSLEAQVAGVFGVTDVTGQFEELTSALIRFDAEEAALDDARRERLATIEAEIAAMDEAAAASGEATTAVGEATAAAGGTSGAFGGLGSGLSMLHDEGLRTGEGMAALGDDVAGAGVAAGEMGLSIADATRSAKQLREEAEALERALAKPDDFFGADEIGRLWTSAADQVATSLIQMIQAVRGESANAAEMEEIRERQFLFTLAAQIQQAQLLLATMEGVSDAVRSMLEGIIVDAEFLLEDIASGGIDLPTGGQSGRGKQRREEARQAAQAFADEMARLTAETSGATQAEREYLAARERLEESKRKGKVSTDELARALYLLAEVQMTPIIDDWTQAADKLRKIDFRLVMDDIVRRAQEDLALAAEANADNPEAASEATRAINEGVKAEMEALGQSALDSLGNPFRSVRQQFRETARSIRFMLNNLDDLGLTAEQVANVVRGAVLPGLLDTIEAQARRVGDEEALKIIQERRAKLELAIARITFEHQVMLLEAAGAITPAIQEMIDLGRELFDVGVDLSNVTSDLEPPPEGWWQIPNSSSGSSSPSTTPSAQTAGETLLEIINQLQRDMATPMERLAMQFEDMMERITNASGTAAEAALATALAQEWYAEQLARLQDQTLEGLRGLIEGAQQAVESRQAPVLQLSAARTAFEQARAAFDPTDESSVQALEEAARRYLDIAASFTDLVGGGAVLGTAQESVAGLADLLPGAFVPSPTAPSATDFSNFAAPAPSPSPVVNVNMGGIESRLVAIENRLSSIEGVNRQSLTQETRTANSISATLQELTR